MANPRTWVITAGRQIIDIPVYDQLIREFVNADNNFTATLLEQINQWRMYDFAFAGGKDMTFLDLGANMGLVSLYAYDVCGRIVAVEPSPATFKVLNRMAGYFPKIEPIEAALAGADGPLVFHDNDANTTASSVVNTYGTELQVKGMTLASILAEKRLKHVDFCKVDVEGSEVDALTAEQVENAEPVIDAYYIETHNCPTSTWQFKLGKLTEMLVGAGYGNIKIEGMTLYAKK